MDLNQLGTIVSSVTFETSGPLRDLNHDEVLDIVSEQSSEMKRLQSFVSKLEADSKSLKEKLSNLEKERSNVRKEITKVKEDEVAVSRKIQRLKTEIRDTEHKINNAKTASGVTEKEKEILQQHMTELQAYKDMTGIRWNFNVPGDTIEGLITNSKKKFVKAFQFSKSMPAKKIKETLWSHIKEAGTVSWDQLEENKENQQK